MPSALRKALQQRMVQRPTPRMSAGSPVNFVITSRLAATMDSQRSSSGCTAYPGCGCSMGRSVRLASQTIVPSRS